MKIVIIIICLAAAARLVKWLVEQYNKTKPKLVLEELTLEKKLQELKKCGISLLPGFSIEYLLGKFERADYEKPGFDLLLSVMGGDDEGESFRHISNCLYEFDTECVEGDGSYVVQIDRMATITGELLKVSNVTDSVDFENQKAWAKFVCNGREVQLEIEIDNDWFDTIAMACLGAFLRHEDTGKSYYFLCNNDQTMVIGCLSHSNAKKLNQLGVMVVELGVGFPMPRCTVQGLESWPH